MTSHADPQLDPKLIRCPVCNKLLFKMSHLTALAGGLCFYVTMKCERCSNRRGAVVYVSVNITLEPLTQPDIDLQPENFASA